MACAMFRSLLLTAGMRTMNRATMSDFRLDNYLWMYRKQAAFSQADIAFLLGVESAAEMSRHEKGRRLPSLDTVLAYEVILGAPVGELFAGKRERLEQNIARRAKRLAKEINPTGATLDALTRIANLAFDP